MKLFNLILICFLFYFQCFSQSIVFQSAKERNANKPQLFIKDSIKALFNEEYIEDILSMSLDEDVEIELTKHTTFKGRVILIHNTSTDVVTMSLKSHNVDSLTLILSRVTVIPDEVIYRCLLMSNTHKDVLVLEKDKHDGKYYWTRKEVADLIPD
jgi:hypothetical protein